MSDALPQFAQTGPEKTYHDALAAGQFRIQRCNECKQHVFYPRVVCSHCGAPGLSWVTPSGNGIVYSTTIVRRKPDLGGDLNIALIDLEEGVRMMSRVDTVRPDQVTIGMAVRASVIVENDQPLVVFTPVGEVV
jgi:uncharacterized OB-fold protein